MRVLGYLLEQFRETLPATTAEAGPFIAGFTWAFVLHWVVLIAMTWAYLSGLR